VNQELSVSAALKAMLDLQVNVVVLVRLAKKVLLVQPVLQVLEVHQEL
jgi:hypothetical protein